MKAIPKKQVRYPSTLTFSYSVDTYPELQLTISRLSDGATVVIPMKQEEAPAIAAILESDDARARVINGNRQISHEKDTRNGWFKLYLIRIDTPFGFAEIHANQKVSLIESLTKAGKNTVSLI